MLMEQLSKQKRIDWNNVLIIGIIGFIVGVMVGFVLFSPSIVFGQTLEEYETMKMEVLNGPYTEVMQITQNATNFTEGYMIDNYVKIIENATDYSGLGE